MRHLLTTALALSALLSTLPEAARAQDYQWARGVHAANVGGINTSASATATAIGPSGEVYTAYYHTGAITVGNQTYPASAQAGSCVLIRYDAAGNVLGDLLTSINGRITDLETDAAGNVYAIGRFRGSVRSGATQLTSAAGRIDYFIGKWDATGALQWLRQGVTANQSGQLQYDEALAVDAAGQVTIVGSTQTNVTIGGTTLTTTSAPALNYSTMFCCRLDASGNAVWGQTSANQVSTISVGDVAVDEQLGTIYLAGRGGGFTWGGQTVGASTDRAFWMQLNGASGALLNSFATNAQVGSGPYVAAAENGFSFIAMGAWSTSLTLNGAPVLSPPNTSSVVVAARLDPSGVPQWVQALPTIDSAYVHLHDISSAPSSAALRTGSAGITDLYLGCSYMSFRDPVVLGTWTLPVTGFRNQTDGFVGVLDGSTGGTSWFRAAGAGEQYDAVTSLSVSQSGQIAVAGDAGGDSLRFGPVRISYPAGAGFSRSYTSKILQSYNQIQGTVYTDANGDGTLTSGEPVHSGMIVEAQPGTQYYSTETNGQYNAVTDLGTYTLSLPSLPLYHTLAASPAPVPFSTYGNVATGHDFRLQAIPNQQDLQAFVTPVGRARAGFTVHYRVTYRNVGTVAIASGSVSMVHDAALSYLSNTGGATHTGNTVSLTYTNLQPGQTRNFDVVFQLPTSTQVGTVLHSTATVEPLAGDLTPADNTETNQLTVTGPFDPNDISVNYERLTPQQVAGGQWLEYTIRFQNVGNDTAFSVLLRDALPASLLNLGSIQMLASSHNCAWNLNPSGVMTVSFTSIKLPPQSINTIGSHGFVRFRVKPKTSLVVGDLIPNQADIHFDFNAPVPTNTALTEVQNATGLAQEPGSLPGAVWPNPTTSELNVEASLPVGGPLTLTLVDATGRTVLARTLSAAKGLVSEKLDVRELPAGLYLLRVQAGGQGLTRRVVVR